MDWNQIGQGVAIGFSAAVPAVVGLAWAVRRVFNLAVWKETLATKEDLAALRMEIKEEIAAHRAETKEEIAAHRAETKEEIAALQEEIKEELAAHRAETKEEIAALQEANEAAHAGINARIDTLQTDVDELKSVVASLVTSVDALRSDMGRVLDHLLGSQSK